MSGGECPAPSGTALNSGDYWHIDKTLVDQSISQEIFISSAHDTHCKKSNMSWTGRQHCNCLWYLAPNFNLIALNRFHQRKRKRWKYTPFVNTSDKCQTAYVCLQDHSRLTAIKIVYIYCYIRRMTAPEEMVTFNSPNPNGQHCKSLYWSIKYKGPKLQSLKILQLYQ